VLLSDYSEEGRQSPEIADDYGISLASTEWRLRTIGIDVQLRLRGLPSLI
jgi:hypothetical protein